MASKEAHERVDKAMREIMAHPAVVAEVAAEATPQQPEYGDELDYGPFGKLPNPPDNPDAPYRGEIPYEDLPPFPDPQVAP